MAMAEVNGTRLFWDEVGEGPVALMLHGGLGFDHTYFRPRFDQLADVGRRVVYLDQRGNGRSDPVSMDTVTMEQLADDAAAVLRHLGAAGDDTVVIGHSYGGFVAQELALRHPQAVGGLVLVGSGAGQLGAGEAADVDEQGPPPPPELADVMSTFPADDEDFRRMGERLMPFYFLRRTSEEIGEITSRTILRRDVMVRSMAVLGEWSSVDRLASITQPVLLVVGEGDYFTSPPQSKRIAARVPDAELHVIPGAGHMVFHDDPDAFFDIVEEWLSRRARR